VLMNPKPLSVSFLIVPSAMADPKKSGRAVRPEQMAPATRQREEYSA
jgi:hypothetical protein